MSLRVIDPTLRNLQPLDSIAVHDTAESGAEFGRLSRWNTNGTRLSRRQPALIVGCTDTLATLRGTAPHSAIVVCSGILTDELQHQAALFGAAALLEKPVTPDQLVETVARAA
jgi:DNA-binding NtrC family response regulator